MTSTINNKLLAFFACFLLSLTVTVADEIKYIDIHQAKQLHDQGALFVDSRTWIERKFGIIKGSVVMDKSEVADVAQYLIIDESRAVVTYCAVGIRASDTAAALNEMGYANLYVIANGQGFSHWKKAGYPTSR